MQNWTLNFTTGSAPGIIHEAAPMCQQEYAVQTALRFSWILFIFLLFLIVYFGRLRPHVIKLAAHIAQAQGWDEVVVLKQLDRVVMIIAAGLSAVVTQALRTVVG